MANKPIANGNLLFIAVSCAKTHAT